MFEKIILNDTENQRLQKAKEIRKVSHMDGKFYLIEVFIWQDFYFACLRDIKCRPRLLSLVNNPNRAAWS